MKHFKFIVWTASFFLIISSGTLFLEYKETSRTRKELKNKSQKLQELNKAERKIKFLKKKKISLHLEKMNLEEQIPLNKVESLSSIKNITVLAAKSGIKKIEFISSQETEDKKMGTFSLRKSFSGSSLQNGSSAFTSSSTQSFRGTASVSNNLFIIRPRFIQVNLECNYSNLVSFLREVLKLKRITSIESIKIKRMKNILPRQKVTLNLVTYTFVPAQK